MDALTSDSRPRVGQTVAESGRFPLLAVIFLLCLVIPIGFSIGPLRLSPYRLLLLICVVPCLLRWLAGGAGPIRVIDICVVLIGAWAAMSWLALHDSAIAVEAAGIEIVETMGAFFLARCAIRSAAQFRIVAVSFFLIVVAMLPFLVYESFTGQNLILRAARAIGSAYAPAESMPRLGLERAQGPFQHPILLGVFCGAGISLAYYVVAEGRPIVARASRTVTVFLAAFTSLSSGPFGGIAVQFLMIIWERTLQGFRLRWHALAGLMGLAYIVVDLISSRTPMVVLTHYLAFNAQTARGRILIWEWGWRDIFKHPVLGNVLGDWERLPWMTASVDMFWLQRMMSHGLPMGVFYLIGLVAICLKVTRVPISNPRLRDYRLGYIGTVAGMFIVGWGVHFWNESYVLLMFLIGSGVWLLDHKEPAPSPLPSTAETRRPRAVIGDLRPRRG